MSLIPQMVEYPFKVKVFSVPQPCMPESHYAQYQRPGLAKS